jgi:hypothetical protein
MPPLLTPSQMMLTALVIVIPAPLLLKSPGSRQSISPPTAVLL